MATSEIWHEVGINAAPSEIYRALTNVDKLAEWWTSDTRGESRTGKTLEFRFGRFCQVMEVGALEPGKHVQWLPTEAGAADWVGTSIDFTIIPDEKQSLVHFRHSGWREGAGIQPHCSIKWAVFMLSLKDLLETGKGRAFPNDVQVNHRTAAAH
jgi:uncharacterized protein YndB with AHSA1/START domain